MFGVDLLISVLLKSWLYSQVEFCKTFDILYEMKQTKILLLTLALLLVSQQANALVELGCTTAGHSVCIFGIPNTCMQEKFIMTSLPRLSFIQKQKSGHHYGVEILALKYPVMANHIKKIIFAFYFNQACDYDSECCSNICLSDHTCSCSETFQRVRSAKL